MRLKMAVSTLLSAFLGAVALSAQQPLTTKVSDRAARVIATYGNLPLTFEANQGQTSGQVNFLSRGNGYTAFLTSGGMVLSLRHKPVSGSGTPVSQPAKKNVLQFRLLGANKNPAAVGEEQQPGKANYFIGNIPAKWQRNVPTFARVRYKNVYPGIDLIYYGNHRQLEYDFALSPGADPSRIQFEITGAKQNRIDAEGNLILTTDSGDLRFQSPIVYQEAGGRRVPVEGGYAAKDSTHFGFRVANYDASKPLVIDPVLLYSTYLGGSGNDQPTGLVVDGSGNVYITGYTDSTDFPLANPGVLPSGSTHVFVAKLDATGSNLLYADYIGGNSQDYGYALVLNQSNEVFVTGSTASSDFPVVNAYQSVYPGSLNAFLSKISADGSSLTYSTYLGGNGTDLPSGIAIDGASNVFVAGNTTSRNFPVASAFQGSASANQSGEFGNYGFLTKFSPDGSSLLFSTYLGGSATALLVCNGSPCYPSPFSAINGVAVDGSGNAYVVGTTNTNNFPTTSGAFLTTNTTAQNDYIGFVSKFNSSGTIGYSTYFYETSGFLTNVNAVAVDTSGSAYVTGAALSDGTFPVTSTTICDPSVDGFTCSYAFVTKFDPTGSSLLYSTFLGANNSADPRMIALDSSDDAYVLASTSSSSFADVNGIEAYSSGNDLLLVEIDPLASAQLFATYLGGGGDETPAGLALDASGSMYVAGMTTSTDLPIIPGAFEALAGGNNDAFVMKIGASSAPALSVAPAVLEYSSQAVGSSSQAQTVVLRNMGSSSMTVTSITASGDFSETDNCGSSLPAAGSCTLSVTFNATASGTRTGTITIQDDAAGSAHVIPLAGIGSSAAVSLNPSSLTFSAQAVGTPSAAQTVTFTNSGNATLNISSIQATGDFAQVSTCTATLAANASCTISVTFTPTVTGTRNGVLTIADDAAGSPQTLNLTGTGSPNANLSATLAPGTLQFASEPLTSVSAAQIVTLTNAGATLMAVSSVQITGDYQQTNNCGAHLLAGASCTISVTFSPKQTGLRSGTLTVWNGVSGGSQSTTLSGSGADFRIAGSPGNDTIQAATPATYSLTLSPVGGAFSSAVSLSCSGLPANATCSFSPSVVTPGASNASVKLTIAMNSSLASAGRSVPVRHQPSLAFWIELQSLGIFGVVLTSCGKRSKRIIPFIPLTFILLGAMFMSGCGGGSASPSTSTGSAHTVTVTGTSGNLHHSVPLTLTVE